MFRTALARSSGSRCELHGACPLACSYLVSWTSPTKTGRSVDSSSELTLISSGVVSFWLNRCKISHSTPSKCDDWHMVLRLYLVIFPSLINGGALPFSFRRSSPFLRIIYPKVALLVNRSTVRTVSAHCRFFRRLCLSNGDRNDGGFFGLLMVRCFHQK